MLPDNEHTVAFGLSKFLMSIEGPSSTLGLLIAMLYDQADLPRSDWSVSHTAANRPSFIRQLRAAGSVNRRIGIAVHTEQAVETITRHARRLRLTCHSLMTHADMGAPPP